jgi:hypothetical protein
MEKVSLLRKLIREEIVSALRQELPKILKESSNQKFGVNNVISEIKKSEIPKTLNTVDTYTKKPTVNYTNSSYLNSLLNETAVSMQQEDFSFTSDDVNPISFFQPQEAKVGDVNGMLSSARPSSDISMVQINEVPDYTGLMKNLIDKGAI